MANEFTFQDEVYLVSRPEIEALAADPQRIRTNILFALVGLSVGTALPAIYALNALIQSPPTVTAEIIALLVFVASTSAAITFASADAKGRKQRRQLLQDIRANRRHQRTMTCKLP